MSARLEQHTAKNTQPSGWKKKKWKEEEERRNIMLIIRAVLVGVVVLQIVIHVSPASPGEGGGGEGEEGKQYPTNLVTGCPNATAGVKIVKKKEALAQPDAT